MASIVTNRADKACRIADFLGDADPVVVAAFGEPEWVRVAELAGEGYPSPATRSGVLAVLRERARCAIDPFAGLPS